MDMMKCKKKGSAIIMTGDFNIKWNQKRGSGGWNPLNVLASRCGLVAKVYMENPVGNLQRRPYMRGWEAELIRKVEIHYCAYGHHYHKPTHLWTNLTEEEWQPRGQTGTGRCEKRCAIGEVGSKGRWVHKYKIAQGSTQAKGGKGRKANKNMMPQALHEELLAAAGVL